MIGVHVIRDHALVQMVRELCPRLGATRADVNLLDGGFGFPSPGDMDDGVLAMLQERCLELPWERFKLVITLFAGSMLAGQQHILGNYGMPVEVCTVSYQRLGADGGDPVWAR